MGIYAIVSGGFHLAKASTKVIALAGKGGVGKTTLSAAFVRILIEERPGARILAIDADPAVGLATALGIQVASTVDDIRNSVIEIAQSGAAHKAVELLGEARYRMLDTLVEEAGFSFLAIGRPETAGCYCQVNAYLKEVIRMISASFDYVVIDGEAGIEQINRRVMENVTHLVLVTDASRKGTQVAATICRVAQPLVNYERCGAIVNRLPDAVPADSVSVDGVDILCCIGNDGVHAVNEVRGESIFSLPADALVLRGARQALHGLGLL